VQFFDRDLSWLSFNYRVLMEAMDERVPLMERLRFIAIYSSNLDEFFRVRVAGLRNIKQINKKKINKRLDFNASDLLDDIHNEVSHQLDQYGIAMRNIIDQLKERNHVICTHTSEIPSELNDELLAYFKTYISAFLRPKKLDNNTELFLNNQAIYLAVQLGPGDICMLNIPTDHLSRVSAYEVGGKTYYIFLDDVIRLHLDIIFPDEEIKGSFSVKLNRDADLQIDDEYSANLVKKIEKQIQKRNLGPPARFLFDINMPDDLLAELAVHLELSADDMVTGGRYHNLNDFFEIDISDPELVYKAQTPVPVPALMQSRSILKSIDQEDYLLHFPYQSYDYILQFFNEAAIDPEVEEINVTFYRMAKKSTIAEALISAAQNGKKVAVFMEVKARFDEENNMKQAQRLQKAGCFVIYGVGSLKTHTKLLLIVRKEKEKVTRFVHMSSGNYNEATAKLYTDMSLLTSDESYANDVQEFFNVITGHSMPEKYDNLITAPTQMRSELIALINAERENAAAGKPSGIVIKLNSLQDKDAILALYEASKAGVPIKLIVRGICCLRPGREGLSENITVRSIVGEYLEHSRIFYFHHEGDPKVYCGSADMMVRSFDRRLESLFIIRDPLLKQQAINILAYNLKDNVNTYEMKEDGSYVHLEPNGHPPFDIHQEFYKVKREVIMKAKLF